MRVCVCGVRVARDERDVRLVRGVRAGLLCVVCEVRVVSVVSMIIVLTCATHLKVAGLMIRSMFADECGDAACTDDKSSK